MKLKYAFAIGAAVFWLLSAICWALSASVDIPDDLYTFVSALHRAASWNTGAAWCACIAAVFSLVVIICEARR